MGAEEEEEEEAVGREGEGGNGGRVVDGETEGGDVTADDGEEEEEAVGREGEGGNGGRVVDGETEGGDVTVDDGENAEEAVVCSICFEPVLAGGGDKSTARLQCGHEFHLDCIGSAFNAKGVMQCPNCRKIEKGNWLYANGPLPSPDVNIEEQANNDEDFHDASQPEASRSVFWPFRFRWCPVSRLAQLPSLFDEGETAAPVTFHDFMGQNYSSEHLPVSTTGPIPPGPYVAYFQPFQSSALSSSHVTERTMDGATHHDHWNPYAGPSDGRTLPTVHPIDFHHNHWTDLLNSYSQPSNNNGVAEQVVIPGAPMRVGGLDSDNQQHRYLPSVYGNGSGSMSRIPSVPPMAPQFMRPHDNINEQYQQSSSSLFTAPQRSGGMHMQTLGAAGPAMPSALHSAGFSLFPQAPSGPNSTETQDAGGNQFYAWERDRFAPYPLVPVDSEANGWGSWQQSHVTPDPAAAAPNRLFRQWTGPGRSSQAQAQAPPPPPPENRPPGNSSFGQMRNPRM